MTKKCKSCQKDIDIEAKRCSHCGTDQRNWFSRHYIVIGILVVIIILGIFGGIKHITSSSQEQVEQNQPTPTITRHDNSGAGNTDENSPIQDHMQRALQHLGL